MDGLNPALVRHVSYGLFTNRHKLDVLASIASLANEGIVDIYPRQVSKLVPDAADNQVAKIVAQLAQAGLLVRIENKSDPLRHYYRIQDSTLWAAMDTFRAEAAAGSWPEGF